MRNTPVSSVVGSQPLKQISIPRVPGSRIRWSSNTINDIAKNAGIKKVAYCDRHLYRVLLGIWEEDSIIVYGQ